MKMATKYSAFTMRLCGLRISYAKWSGGAVTELDDEDTGFPILDYSKNYKHILTDEIKSGREWFKDYLSDHDMELFIELGSHLVEVKT